MIGSDNGKGSGVRPYNPVAYGENYDSIFKEKLCKDCHDYNICCEIGRCGNSNKGCFNNDNG